ncbi:tetratricopeptide repeat protein [Treponema primitia]|uniref:tetratricopeptide repeat protein n=1 Tax=Treponema primitia TaxID=88058 RepID=UPI0002554F0E|nr:tetratricopeptide repeat protein [Treponema primitia]
MNTGYPRIFLLLTILPWFFSCSSRPAEQAPATEMAAVSVPFVEVLAAQEIPQTDTESILSAVADFLGRGDYDGALACFERLDSEVAATSNIRLLKASVLSSAGRVREARSIIEGIIAGDANNTEALYVLSTLESAQGKEREQKTILERIIKIDPNHVRALSALGNIAVLAKSLQTAASYFDKALAADPNNGDALLGRAGVYRYQRNPKAAESLLNKAVTLYPQWTRPLTERARLYEGAGFYTDALNDLDRAKSINSNDYWIAVDRGIVLVDLQRKQEALPEFNRAIGIDPNMFIAYVYSAGIKDELGDYEGAEHDYEVLAKLKPDYYFAFEGVGIHKMRRGLWAEARDAFMATYRQTPETFSYALLTSLCWMRAGRIMDPKPFLAEVLRKVKRDSLEWYVIRLYHDLNGDSDVAARIDQEQNLTLKAQMLYYLASYYDVRGNTTLANRYFTQAYDMGERTIIEWRFTEWVVEERNLKAP